MNPFQNSFGGHIPQDVAGKQGENVIFIVYNLTDSPDTVDKVKDVCANFSAMIRSMRNRFPDMQFSCTMGFGADAWTRLFPDKGKPKELSTFSEIKGEKYTAVSTPGDLLFHIRAKQMGLCFEFASILDEKLKGAAVSGDETHGFRYMDGKEIIGFVVGTENPAVDENHYHFAVIGEEDADFAGGSYVFVQKYIHDMVAWNALPVEQQEKVIGRHKFNDVELSDEEKPGNAHNAVTNIGDDLKIVRANMPFANTSKGEYGTYFIGYASTFSTTHKMLENMFIGSPAGNTDRLLDFSTAITVLLYAHFLFSSAYMGFTNGVAPIFSYNYGAGNYADLKKLFAMCIRILLAAGIVIFAISQLAAGWTMRIFVGNNTALYEMSLSGFRLFAFCFLVNGINIFASGYLTALGNGRDSAVVSILRTLIVEVIAIVGLAYLFGINGVWMAIPVAEFVCLFVSVYMFHKNKIRI